VVDMAVYVGITYTYQRFCFLVYGSLVAYDNTI